MVLLFRVKVNIRYFIYEYITISQPRNPRFGDATIVAWAARRVSNDAHESSRLKLSVRNRLYKHVCLRRRKVAFDFPTLLAVAFANQFCNPLVVSVDPTVSDFK